MGDRETGVMIGDRQRHRRLAVGLLAELSAILMAFGLSENFRQLLSGLAVDASPNIGLGSVGEAPKAAAVHSRQHRPKPCGRTP
jgi:hypothetical protein